MDVLIFLVMFFALLGAIVYFIIRYVKWNKMKRFGEILGGSEYPKVKITVEDGKNDCFVICRFLNPVKIDKDDIKSYYKYNDKEIVENDFRKRDEVGDIIEYIGVYTNDKGNFLLGLNEDGKKVFDNMLKNSKTAKVIEQEEPNGVVINGDYVGYSVYISTDNIVIKNDDEIIEEIDAKNINAYNIPNQKEISENEFLKGIDKINREHNRNDALIYIAYNDDKQLMFSLPNECFETFNSMLKKYSNTIIEIKL